MVADKAWPLCLESVLGFSRPVFFAVCWSLGRRVRQGTNVGITLHEGKLLSATRRIAKLLQFVTIVPLHLGR